MGWPDDPVSDLGRDDHPFFDSHQRAGPFGDDPENPSDRDPQQGSWDE